MRVRLMAAAVAVCGAGCAAGCSHLPHWHMPWSHRPAPPPQAVHELVITGAAGAAAPFPQYWNRNTLVVDLRGISGTGEIVLATPAGTTWPFRLALRVMPGSVGELDVRGEQRWVVPIVRTGAQPVDLVLPTALYTRATSRINVGWAPAPSSHAAEPLPGER
ncbi:MAG TPA: hypothetical protein VN730_15945 [Steroidobacteraceae bacterium]|nr:hypothetical protein [Steroidobacteraceae bacterium]